MSSDLKASNHKKDTNHNKDNNDKKDNMQIKISTRATIKPAKEGSDTERFCIYSANLITKVCRSKSLPI